MVARSGLLPCDSPSSSSSLSLSEYSGCSRVSTRDIFAAVLSQLQPTRRVSSENDNITSSVRHHGDQDILVHGRVAYYSSEFFVWVVVVGVSKRGQLNGLNTEPDTRRPGRLT
jgi:hypothetical protein